MSKQSKGGEPLEEHLLAVLRALDNQVAREMQRSPAEREEHGVQKWEPYAKRIEKLCALALDAFGEGKCGLDGVLIMGQAMAKILRILTEELAREGLGEVRAAYCAAALQAIERDARHGLSALNPEGGQLM